MKWDRQTRSISFLCWENKTEWCHASLETDKDSAGDGQQRAERVEGHTRRSQMIRNDSFLSFHDLSAPQVCETRLDGMQNTKSAFFSVMGQNKSLLLVDVQTNSHEPCAIKHPIF